MTTPNPAPPTPTPPTNDPAPTPTPPAPPAPGSGGTFTQADLDRVLTTRLAEQQRKHEAALQEAQADAGRNETQRLEAQVAAASARADGVVKAAGPKVAQALAQVSAISAGGRADRAEAIVRQADLSDVVTVDGDEFVVDQAKVTAAIEKVLTDYPEWKAETTTAAAPPTTPPAGSATAPASGGDLGGGAGDAVTLDAFTRMNMGERTALANSKPDEYRRLADAEIDVRRRVGR